MWSLSQEIKKVTIISELLLVSLSNCFFFSSVEVWGQGGSQKSIFHFQVGKGAGQSQEILSLAEDS